MSGALLVVVFGAAALVLLGAFIGYSLAERTLDRQVRRQASAQRLIGEQWRALRAAQARHRASLLPGAGRVGEDPQEGDGSGR